ncbi:41038_t:CDS:2 [Gigaspora margarita]|uniref:41038_t:CDS:1 n=1 Tax=Gigaspora margarita TaxID=4874 RepID=A0ABM8VXZ7_GIGMA|nr:41038_t:CDS:2 [Gigaspora margarita]
MYHLSEFISSRFSFTFRNLLNFQSLSVHTHNHTTFKTNLSDVNKVKKSTEDKENKCDSKKIKRKRSEETTSSKRIKKDSNHKIGHDFEAKMTKKFNNNDMLAQGLLCSPGDFGIDILVTYKKKAFLVQCKSQIDPISLGVIQRLNANVSRFDDSMTYILLYDSEKLEKPLTKFAEAWVKNV